MMEGEQNIEKKTKQKKKGKKRKPQKNKGKKKKTQKKEGKKKENQRKKRTKKVLAFCKNLLHFFSLSFLSIVKMIEKIVTIFVIFCM